MSLLPVKACNWSLSIVFCSSQKIARSFAPNMMPTVKGMSHKIPNHVLQVGQTIRLDSAQETCNKHPSLTEPSGYHGDPDLDISLDKLNQLILELDPMFEPIQVNSSPPCISPPTGMAEFPPPLPMNMITCHFLKSSTKDRLPKHLSFFLRLNW